MNPSNDGGNVIDFGGGWSGSGNVDNVKVLDGVNGNGAVSICSFGSNVWMRNLECSVIGAYASNGGALTLRGEAEVLDSVFSNIGRAIYLLGSGTARIVECRFSDVGRGIYIGSVSNLYGGGCHFSGSQRSGDSFIYLGFVSEVRLELCCFQADEGSEGRAIDSANGGSIYLIRGNCFRQGETNAVRGVTVESNASACVLSSFGCTFCESECASAGFTETEGFSGTAVAAGSESFSGTERMRTSGGMSESDGFLHTSNISASEAYSLTEKRAASGKLSGSNKITDSKQLSDSDKWNSSNVLNESKCFTSNEWTETGMNSVTNIYDRSRVMGKSNVYGKSDEIDFSSVLRESDIGTMSLALSEIGRAHV
jgi:hypothetical protein